MPLSESDKASLNLWQSEQYKRILGELHKSLSNKKSCIVLTGDRGVGKTAMINQFIQEADELTKSLIISGEQRDEFELYSSIASGFGVGSRFASKVQFFVEFGNFLYKCNEQKQKVVLIVDDCHLLKQTFLEIIRQLANIENGGKRLLHLFLVGDKGFDQTLDYSKNRTLRLSLALRETLEPFSLKETAEYVNFRLEAVGHKEKVFCLKGIEAVHKATRGIVRDINLLCEHILAGNGYVSGGIAVELSIIHDSIEQLGLGRESEPGTIPIAENPRQQKREKEILYQSPDLEDTGEASVFIREPDFPIKKNRKRAVVLWLGLTVFTVAGGFGSFWLYHQGQQFKREQFLAARPENKPRIVVPLVQPTRKAEVSQAKVLENKSASLSTATEEELTGKVLSEELQSRAERVVENPSTVLRGLPEQPEIPDFPVEGDGKAIVDVAANIEPGDSETELSEESVESQEVEVVKDAAEGVKQVLTQPPLPVKTTVLSPEPPAAKAEPVLKPLTGIEEPLHLEEQLALELDKGDVEEPSVITVEKSEDEKHIVQLATVSKKRIAPPEAASDRSALLAQTYTFRLKPGSPEMTDSSKARFEEFVELAGENPELPIQVRGYVSSDDDSEENRELSRKRAIQMYKMLLDRGVEFTRIQVLGMGVQDPVASNATPQGRYKNRRVELEFVTDNE